MKCYKRVGVGIADAVTRCFACKLLLADILFLALSLVQAWSKIFFMWHSQAC